MEKARLPLVCFEDEHLLVVNKPPGLNTHSPSPYAGEGVYEWLRNREPRWASLAIIHRLDKETSGIMVFTKTPEANRSLAAQFEGRRVKKTYVFLTDRAVGKREFAVKSTLVRAGDKYVGRPAHAGGAEAETRFRVLRKQGEHTLVEAEPLTGRTHQIRVHAADSEIPIRGDSVYGGSPASRLCLHAQSLQFAHPVTNETLAFEAPLDFDADPRHALRAQLVDAEATDSFRIVHGASDGWPGWYVDKLGEFVLSRSASDVSEDQLRFLKSIPARGVYHKSLTRQIRKTKAVDASPTFIFGEPAPERFTIIENDVRYEISFAEGYSVGLFLDQRDNRRRLLVSYAGPGLTLFDGLRGREVLNTFAYTCGFSVCAAKAGARVTSLDLSKKYLDWGRRNFELNNLDHTQHDFIYGDAFDWMRRLHKKGRKFDLIILDPPTFSQSKEHGTFRAEKDYGKLVKASMPLLKDGGVLFASTNAAEWPPEGFLRALRAGITGAGRRVLHEYYLPQPPDFPVSREEPAYLKTAWLRVS